MPIDDDYFQLWKIEPPIFDRTQSGKCDYRKISLEFNACRPKPEWPALVGFGHVPVGR
jgi:hypothetical protein